MYSQPTGGEEEEEEGQPSSIAHPSFIKIDDIAVTV